MRRLSKLLDSIAWYKLVPSGMSGMQTLITAGGGAYGQGDYVTAAAATDRSFLLAYLPPEASSGGIAINMGALAGPARARWFDPTSAMFIEIPGNPFHNSGSRTFSIPGNNASGARDWVLVVETTKYLGH
jgi:hypothetical protein